MTATMTETDLTACMRECWGLITDGMSKEDFFAASAVMIQDRMHSGAQGVATPSDALDMLALADEYEAGLKKLVASGYEEYGREIQRKHKLTIQALRATGHASLGSSLPSTERQEGGK